MEERTLPETDKEVEEEKTEEKEEETEEEEKEDKVFDLASLPKEVQVEFNKLKEERDNYEKGMIAAKKKAKIEKKLPVAPKDDIDEKVLNVLYKENEKTAIKAVVDSESEHYIAELVDDDTWKAVMGYLPVNLDKSSVKTIHKGLKAALAAYKSVEGTQEGVDESKEAKADLLKSSKSSGTAPKGDTPPTLNIPKSTGMQDWFQKKDV